MDMEAKPGQKDPRHAAAAGYIQLVLKEKKLTGAELASDIKVSASTINKPISEHPAKSPPSIKTLTKIRNFHKVPFTTEVIQAYELPIEVAPEASPEYGHETARLPYEYPSKRAGESDIKLLGVSYCGALGDFVIDHTGDPIDFVDRPPGLEKASDVFAIHIMGDSMLPWYKPGEVFFLSDKRPPLVHNLVVVELYPEKEGDPCPSLFKLLLRRNDDFIELQQSNPPKVFKIKTSKVKRIYRVLQTRELIGI